MTIKKQLIVFDFDWSMADQDSDRWVFEVLAPDIRRKNKALKNEIQWTDLITQSLQDIHSRGITKDQILHALRIMPFHPAMVRAVKNLKESGDTTFLCLSNSNSVFISTILEDKGLTSLFDEIITNPAEWTSSGLLSLKRRIDPTGPQHCCQVGCAPNMCKGAELDTYLKRKGIQFDRIIYIGDGANDFCPILRLRSQDTVFCRANRSLQKRIENEGALKRLKSSIIYWGGAWEIEEQLPELDASSLKSTP